MGKNNIKQKSKNSTDNNFSIANIDTAIDPFDDFYFYSCGNWIKKHQIPKDKTYIDSFSLVSDKRDLQLKHIVKYSVKHKNESVNSRIVNDLYASFTNTKEIERLKADPIKLYIDNVNGIKDKSEIAFVSSLIAKAGSSVFFDFYSDADNKDSSTYILYLWQGGLNLPDRDYYIKKGFSKIIKYYKKHIEHMFTLYGAEKEEAAKFAKDVLHIETQIAKASRPLAETRDVVKNYNKMSIEDIEKNYTNIKIKDFLRYLNAPLIQYAVIGQPEFFEKIDKLIEKTNIEEIKAYMNWSIINTAAPYLDKRFENAHFEFFGKILRGQKSMQPRWKRAIHFINAVAGEAMGELYIKNYFTEESRKYAADMIERIKDSFKHRIANAEWMSESTKRKALEKFSQINTKLGCPKRFRDYSKLKTDPLSLYQNFLNAYLFELEREMKRIGKKVDKNEWLMNAYSINAYYDPSKNEIVIPAGILQPPFFNLKMDDAVNYGGIGGILGHELTHGYDDQGSMFDKKGNLNDWWSKKDRDNFKQRAKKIAKLYGSLEIFKGLKLNGELTLGENIADLGGINIAYDALKNKLSEYANKNRIIDGFTQEQRFFIAWAQIWKGKILEKEARHLALIDPHSPMKIRGLIPPISHVDFYKVFKEKSKRKSIKIKCQGIGLW
ncbi:MAG: M13 family metallopeptidase [Candidatus Micrarchaeia archaeon]